MGSHGLWVYGLMQTFLPYPDFQKSAACLDRNRLNKQRLEVRLLLQELELCHPNTRWNNHPCVRMWRGHPEALVDYGLVVCKEWTGRGYKDAQHDLIYELGDGQFDRSIMRLPEWFGNEEFHAAHRSNLLRKNPEYYGQFGWAETDDLPYFWPDGKLWPQYTTVS